MKVHYGFDDLSGIYNPVVTVGSFDGVHTGHRAIIGTLRRTEGQSVIVTFDPHPRQILDPTGDLRLINSLEEKIFLLDSEGIDHLVVVDFTEEFSRMSSGGFVDDMILGKLRAETIIIGYNHHFGHNREGNYDYLRSRGLNVIEIPRRDVDNEKVSSTIIRKSLIAGDLATANHYLSRPYFLITDISDGIIRIDNSLKLIPPVGRYKVSIAPKHDPLSGAEAVLVIENGTTPRIEGVVPGEKLIVSFIERL